MLMMINDTNPWYANIVNFMVSGYVPPGESKKKLEYESRHHLWDDPTYTGSVLTNYYEDVRPPQRVHKSSRGVTLHHTEVTMEYFTHSPKPRHAASTGLQCIKTRRSSSIDAVSASYKATSVHAMPCHFTSTSKSKFLTSGELTFWAIQEIRLLRAHPCSSWLRIKMGRSITVSSNRCQACKKDVSRDHVSLFWDTKNGDKWRSVTLHW